MSQRSRRWTWTLNNPTREELDQLTGLLEECKESAATNTVKYLLYGKETGAEGTPHLQGYVEFFSLKTMSQVKSALSPRCHLEKSKGSPAQNREYCIKDGEYSEAGMISAQGSRSDIKKVQEMIESGHSDLEIARLYFGLWTRMRSAIREYRLMISPKRVNIIYDITTFTTHWQNFVWGLSTILWGPSDIGKTSFLKARFPRALFVSHLDDLKNFNPTDYEGIIFDDMEFKYLPRTAQIHLLDSSDERSIHIRYGTATIPAGTRKLFSTNEDGGNIFDLTDAAIRRRVDIVEGDNFYE